LLNQSPQLALFLLIAAFVAGWVAAKLGAFLGRRFFGGKRDPREDRIRSLEAELRVAKSTISRAEAATEEINKELAASQSTVDEYASTINDQTAEIERLSLDLRGAVKKMNELREELASRAEENLHATVKLHQVETELSVARAGSELISSSELEYDKDDDRYDDDNGIETGDSKVVKFTI